MELRFRAGILEGGSKGEKTSEVQADGKNLSWKRSKEVCFYDGLKRFTMLYIFLEKQHGSCARNIMHWA